MGTQAYQGPCTDQLTSLPCSVASEQELSSIFLSQALEKDKDKQGPVTSHPTLGAGRSPRYLLSQKRRVWAACTSSTALLRTLAGGSALHRWSCTKLWRARVFSSSLSVRLRRFCVCSPELCAREGAGYLLAVANSYQQPPGGW